MSKALVKRKKSVARGLIPAVASGFVPGLGQFINGESDKALGVFVVAAGAAVASQLPLIGGLAAVVGGVTWLYGVGDGYLRGRKG